MARQLLSLGARGWGLGRRGRRASKPHAEVRTVSGIKNVGKIVVKPPSKNLLVGSPFTWLVAAGMFRFA